MPSPTIPDDLLDAISRDIEPTEEPFAALAASCGMEQEELLQQLRTLLEKGVVRRFGAILNHYAAGMSANAMVVWRVPEPDLERVGRIIASFDAVTHCYERPPLPDLPYNLYSMVHAASWKECEATIRQISQQTGIADYLPLRTLREFKKSSVSLRPEVGRGDAASSEG
jgi:DNA-binding Lrp family transcriptional regulator